jgi:hypothetical protein
MAWSSYAISQMQREHMTRQHTDWLNRHNYTEEEREKTCIELLIEAQYWDSYQYVRHMSDKTKRPWAGLTLNEIDAFEKSSLNRQALCCAIEAKLKEKNNDRTTD